MIIDEIYFLSMFEEGTFQSCLSYSQDWPDPARTHFMWGFSKDFSMSGSRCAVIHSKNRDLHRAFCKDISFYHNVPGIVQMKLCRMLQDKVWVEEYLEESRIRLQRHAGIVMSTLDSLGVSYFKPEGEENFGFCHNINRSKICILSNKFHTDNNKYMTYFCVCSMRS